MRVPRFGGDPVRAGRRRHPAVAPLFGGLATAGRLPRHDIGSVTAEFAMAVPVVVLVLACSLGAIQVASQQVRLTDAAADAARTLARGDPPGVAVDRVHRVASSAAMSMSTSGDFVCVQLSAPAGFGLAALAGVRVRASGCALAGGL
jgi:Flp pilus assembly protein TadG